ncbi:MAG TPA: hypothetical protein PLS53_00855 [Thermoanaerobaculaceae bacterium]|nr:hypothetical protein [Thermoanaerobaculaceae bacterium]HPS76683.1 hypothetical protein [Thermoanaerobaculaceae bacterium]
MNLSTSNPATGHPHARGGALLVLLIALAAIVMLAVAYLLIVLHWTYSAGERAGVLQKLSRKGWVCKTWEGELAMTTVPGVAPVLWSFSVRDEAVAQKLSAAVGRRVVLHYSEHRGIPTDCFGETSTFIESFRIEDTPALAP